MLRKRRELLRFPEHPEDPFQAFVRGAGMRRWSRLGDGSAIDVADTGAIVCRAAYFLPRLTVPPPRGGLMLRRALLPLVAAIACCGVAGCTDDVVAPTGSPRPRAIARAETGPPPPHEFGPDSWRTGVFTGQGTQRPGLSCDRTPPDATSAAVRSCTGYLASAVDGTLLDVSLLIPTKVARPIPLVVLVHGYGGSKSSSGDIARALLGEGYAVLRYSTRGFGHSWGQVNMVDVHAEVADLRSMVAQVVDRPNLHLDADAVAVTGASYGGGHSWMAALQPTWTTPRGNVVHLRTVVPIAAWSDLLYALLPNGRERESVDGPGGAKLSFVNGLYLSGIRRDPERPYPNYPEYFAGWHAWINAMEPTEVDPVFASIEDGLAGYRSIWWQQRFWQQAAATRLPVFMVQGFTDDLFPMSEAGRMLRALRTIDPTYPVAAYFGDIGHPRASNKTGEVEHVLGLIRQWLAYYLRGEGAAPPYVVYAALTRPREETFAAANVIVVSTLDALATDTVSASFDMPAVLVNPATDPAGGFFWDPLVMEGARELRPLPVPPESPLVPGSLATYDVPVATLSGGGALVVAGQPLVALRATTVAYRVQLDVRLFDVDASGTKRLVTRGTYTLDSGTPGVPVGEADVVIPTYGNYWRAEAGHVLRLELTNVDSPYITPSRIPSATAVTGVRLEVPVRRGQ
jgi:predicted acyl esterase